MVCSIPTTYLGSLVILVGDYLPGMITSLGSGDLFIELIKISIFTALRPMDRLRRASSFMRSL